MSESTAIDRAYQRIVGLVGMARIAATRALEGKGIRRVQLRFDETEIQDDRPLAQHYGFASRPKVGADAVVVSVRGERSAVIVIATNDRRHQIELAEGEVILHDDQGQKVHLKRDGIEIDGGGKQVTIRNAPKLLAETLIESTVDVKVGNVSLKDHVHINTQPGAGVSGIPQQ